MKKLLVVLLTVVMLVSLAVVASAEVSTYIGGDFYFRYQSTHKQFEAGNNNFFVGGITAKATKDNTWAKMFINTDTWQGASVSGAQGSESTTPYNSAIKYAVGIDKIADVLSISFSTKDQDICNIGQAPMMDTFDDFKTDPVFNTYDCGNEFAAVIDTASVTVKAESVVMGTANPNVFAIEAIGKFDGGKAYVAYKGNIATDTNSDNVADSWDHSLIDAGVDMKLGEMNLKADAWLETVQGTSLPTVVQANVAQGPWDATLCVSLPQNGGNTTIGVGGNYKLTDKVTVGAKYVNTTDATYEIYGLYNVGAWDVTARYVNPGQGTGMTYGTEPMGWRDPYFALGLHASIW